MRAHVLAVVALSALAACASETSTHGAAFVTAMTEASAAFEQRDLREAARRFDHAAEVAILPADRDEARHEAARALARAGDLSAGLARLDALANEAPPGRESGAAAYDAALLRIDADADPERGFRDLERMIHQFPEDGASRPALHRWLSHLDESDRGAALAWLRRVSPELDHTDRAEEVAFEIALRLERAHDPAAHEAFLAVATRWPYPNGALWDSALAHASQAALATGDAKSAAADLTRMLSRRERASLVGSAERSHYAESQLALGELYRDRLGDHAQALACFHALYTDFPDSSLRDRALFEEGMLRRTDGDNEGACARLSTLVSEFSDSRYAPCALEACPSMRAKPSPHAPTVCHAYLERSLGTSP